MSAKEVAGFKPGILKAAADLSAKQFFAGKLDANGDVVLAGAGERTLGPIQNKPISGEAVELDFDGVSKAVAGAAVTPGTEVMSNAAGKYIPATSGNAVAGVALTGAGADGEFFTMAVVGLKGRVLA